MNVSHTNLLAESFLRSAEYPSKVEMRAQIKMSGGIEYQPRLYYELLSRMNFKSACSIQLLKAKRHEDFQQEYEFFRF